MQNKLTRILALLLSFAMLLALVACGGTASESSAAPESSSEESSSEESSEESSEPEAEKGRWDELVTTDEPIELLIEWGQGTPTVNDEPTEEVPIVKQAGNVLAQQWLADKPNVSINWCYDFERDSEWIIINYTAGTGPDIFDIWGGRDYSDQGWLLDLDDVMASPNYYEEGSPAWIDMFPEYLFGPGEATLSNYGTITGVPVELATGAATGIAYNVALCEELGFGPTTDLDEFEDMCAYIMENTDYVAMMPYNGEIAPTFTAWVAQFSLMPVYAKSVCLDVSDLDGDGSMSVEERLQACYNGGFYMQDNPAMYELYGELFNYFWTVYEEGAMDIDYTQAWSDGEVVFRDVGLFEVPTLRSDTAIDYQWEMFVPPIKQQSEYVTEVEYTTGPYNPALSAAYNVILPSIQDRPDANLDYVVDWMKFMTTAENLSMQVEEGRGAYIGAVKGCAVPQALGDWFSMQFPQLPAQNRLGRPNWTDPTAMEYNALLDNLYYHLITLDEFAVAHDELMYQSVADYLETDEAQEFDTSEWGEQILPASMR